MVAVREVRDEGLFEAGKEFNVALDSKAVYHLTTRQLHDVVGWLRGVVPDQVLEDSLRADPYRAHQELLALGARAVRAVTWCHGKGPDER
ncbi:hypothetical protein AB0903_07755 [Streptomyces sp. NPDC048389]|uniref:hypothetical protein n=1 Tax=Streptomyces sp. NPDC048389 TaxID=3154622 RepID=UPI003454E409